MKRKIIACLIMAALVCTGCMPAFAAEPEGYEEVFSTDFEGGLPDDFFTYFNVYDVKDENIKTEGDNTYYNGLFPQGSYLYSMNEAENYRLEFDIQTGVPGKTEENAYKSALALHVPAQSVGLVIEADNGDSDLTSFLGSGGIFLYLFDNILEVGVHTNKDGGTAGSINGAATTGLVEKAAGRLYGVYTVSYQFTLPEGLNFSEFTPLTVEEENGTITVSVKGTPICSISMSEPENITTVCSEQYWDAALAGQDLFSGESYRKVAIKDAAGEVKATVEEAVVPVSGVFAFANRANHFGLDNLKVYDKIESSTPAPKPTPTASATDQKTKAPATSSEKPPAATPGDSNQSAGQDWLIYVLAGGIVAVGAVLAVLVVRHRKKGK